MGDAPRGQRVRRADVGRARRARPPGAWSRRPPSRGPRSASRGGDPGGRRPGRALRRRRQRRHRRGVPVLALAAASRCPGARARGPRRCRSTSAARSRACSAASTIDVVHVHEPFAPSVSSAALRHSRSLNVGSFYEPSERSALDPGRAAAGRDLPRPPRRADDELRDDRGADGRASSRAPTSGSRPGRITASSPGGPPARPRPTAPTRIAFCLDEERGALRLFLRAIRRLKPRRRLGGRRLDADATEVRVAQKLRAVRPRASAPATPRPRR